MMSMRQLIYFWLLVALHLFTTVLLYVLPQPAQAQDVHTYIPPKALSYVPIMVREQQRFWPDIPEPAYVFALGEHESCITLKHKRCWEPTSTLSTKRELGKGLFQLTKTYREDGTVRFDVLTEMRDKYKVDLKELDWATVEKRADLQIRTMTLMSRDNFKQLYTVKDPLARLHMTDAAYNGGLGGVKKERIACGLKKDCDPQQWWGQVEKTCLKSTVVLYGKRSACDINRDHVRLVFIDILPKYKRYFTAP